MKEKLMELDGLLAEMFKSYGYIRKRKHTYHCKIEGGVQEIHFCPTKTRGKDEACIDIYAGFNYPELNKVICFLRDEQYKKTMFTAFRNIYPFINPNKFYRFYIDPLTDVVAIANDILEKFEKYVFPFLEKCNTLEKYEAMLLNKDEGTRRSALQPIEWNLIALSLLLNRNNSDEVIEEYYDEFAKDLNQLEILKERIKNFNRV